MKRFMCYMLVLFVLVSGCGKKETEEAYSEMDGVRVIEIGSCEVDWENIEFPVDLEGIEELKEIRTVSSTKEAIRIGENIIAHLHKRGKYSEFSLIGVVHSTSDDVWRFNYSVDQRNAPIGDVVLSYCLSVAISGKDGKLIKAWVEE